MSGSIASSDQSITATRPSRAASCKKRTCPQRRSSKLPLTTTSLRATTHFNNPLRDPHFDAEPARHRLLGNHVQISAAAAGIHGPRVLRLVVAQDARRSTLIVGWRTVCGRMASQHSMQSFIEAPRACGVRGQDRVVAVLAGLAQPADPGGIEVLHAQRVVALRPRRHRHHVDHTLQPAGHGRVVVGLDVPGKNPAFVMEIDNPGD